MLTFFTAVLIAKIFEGEEISCRCFGSFSAGNIDLTTVFRNIILIAFGVVLTVYYSFYSQKGKKLIIHENNSLINRIINIRWYVYFKRTLLELVFFFLAIQSLICVMQNRGLKQNISLVLMNNELLQPNDTAQPIEVYDMDSNKVSIKFDGFSKTILYLFSTHCEPCKINIPNWIQLTDVLRKNNFKVLGIATEQVSEVKKFAKTNEVNFQVYSTTNIQFKLDYKAFSTPQTIIISQNGKVVGAYPGVLNKINIPKIFADLSLSY